MSTGRRDRDDPVRSLLRASHHLRADQMGTVRRIYGMSGLDLTAGAEAAMQAYIDSHKRDRHGQLEYRLQEDFGLDPDALAERFRFYSDKFGV